MQLVGLGVVKNEADVIEQSARHALRFCDRIVYLDNGSTDGTWELLQGLAKDGGGRIVVAGQELGPFHDGLRGMIYDDLHGSMGDDDWWIQIDADEFLEVDPRPAIRRAVAARRNRIRTWQAQFVFTDRDLEDWEAGRDDPALPIQQRRRWYSADWRESRLWRNDPNRSWGDGDSTHPAWADRPYPFALVNRHYQFRNPEQMQRRIEDRRGLFPHVTSESWRQDVRPSAGLRNLDADGGRIRLDRRGFVRQRAEIRLRARRVGGVARREPVSPSA